MNKTKLIEWLSRYGRAEITGLICSYSFISTYKFFSYNFSQVIAAFIGTWAENLGYYLTISQKDLKARKFNNPSESAIRRFFYVTKGIFFEFGLSEALDSFLIRPTCLFYSIKTFGPSIGILLGKILADIIFYIPTIFFYELKKKYFR